jgi:hypothetical protein
MTSPHHESPGSGTGNPLPSQNDCRDPRDRTYAAALGAAFLLLYVRTLCPTVYLGDSGEICGAIVQNGVVHPPGYPLFSLLGRLALVLVPVGEPAFRIGVVTAMAAASAVGVVYLLAREAGGSRGAGVLGAAIFGASYALWSQATRVEVYSLHVLLSTAALLSALRFRRDGRRTDLAAAVLAISLGTAHHLTIVLVAPVVLVLCAPRLWRQRGRGLLPALALLPVGPLFYGLLILWARGDSIQAWGLPATLPLLWSHASGRLYSGNLQLPDGPQLAHRLGLGGSLYVDAFPYLLWLLPPAGLWLLRQRDRMLAGALLLFAWTLTAFNVCYRIEDISGYYLPLWAVAAVLVGAALDGIRESRAALMARPAVWAAVGVLLVGAPVLRNWAACDLSGATWVREFARLKLEHCDRGAVLISQGDQDTYPIWYVHDVLGVRPDVLPVDRTMVSGSLVNYDREPSVWYLDRLRRLGVAAPAPSAATDAEWRELARDGYLIRLLEGPLAGRPVAVTFAESAATQGMPFLPWVRRKFHLLPNGLVLRLHPKLEPVRLPELIRHNGRLWDTVSLPDLRRVRTDQELDPRYVADHYASMLLNFGGLYEIAGQPGRARDVYQMLAEWHPDYPAAREALAALRTRSAVRPVSR